MQEDKQIILIDRMNSIEQVMIEVHQNNPKCVAIISDSHRLNVQSMIFILRGLGTCTTELIMKDGCFLNNDIQEILDIFSAIPPQITALNLSGNMLGWRPFIDLHQLFKIFSRKPALKDVYLYWNDLNHLTLHELRLLDRGSSDLSMNNQQTTFHLLGNNISEDLWIFFRHLNRGTKFIIEQSDTEVETLLMMFESFPHRIKKTYEFDRQLSKYTISFSEKCYRETQWIEIFSGLSSLVIPNELFNQIQRQECQITFPYLSHLEIYHHRIRFSVVDQSSTVHAAAGLLMPYLKSLKFSELYASEILSQFEFGALQHIGSTVEKLVMDSIEFQEDDIEKIGDVFSKFRQLKQLSFFFRKGIVRLHPKDLNPAAFLTLLETFSSSIQEIDLHERGLLKNIANWTLDAQKKALSDRMTTALSNLDLRPKTQKLSFDLAGHCDGLTDFKNLRKISILSQLEKEELSPILKMISRLHHSRVHFFHWTFLIMNHKNTFSFFKNDFCDSIFPYLASHTRSSEHPSSHIEFSLEFLNLVPLIVVDTTLNPAQNLNVLLKGQVFPRLPSNVTTLIFRQGQADFFTTSQQLSGFLDAIPISVKKILMIYDEKIKKILPSSKSVFTENFNWLRMMSSRYPEGRLEVIGFFKEKFLEYLLFFEHICRNSQRVFQNRPKPPLPVLPIELIRNIGEYLVSENAVNRFLYQIDSIKRKSGSAIKKTGAN